MTDGVECPECGADFGSARGMKSHRTQVHGGETPPWQDEDTLRELYVEKQMPTEEIGEGLGCADTTVSKWLDTFGIERRTDGEIPKSWLLDDLRRLADEFDRTPTTELVNEHGRYSDPAYYNHFDSFTDALREVGFDPNVRHDITDSELLDDLRRLQNDLERTPQQTDVAELGEFGASIYHSRFGGLGDALKEAGIEPTLRTEVSQEDLLAEIDHLADEHAETPTQRLVNTHGKYSIWWYYEKFGTWLTALDEAGYEPWSQPFGPNNPQWRGGTSISHAVRSALGPRSWPTTTKIHRASVCESCDEPAALLDLHHIIPVLTGGVNEKWNFMTLCRSCHMAAEWFTDQYVENHLTDWSGDELPDGRLSGHEYMKQVTAPSQTEQATISQFATGDE